MKTMLAAAKAAKPEVGSLSMEQKNRALEAMAAALEEGVGVFLQLLIILGAYDTLCADSAILYHLQQELSAKAHTPCPKANSIGHPRLQIDTVKSLIADTPAGF